MDTKYLVMLEKLECLQCFQGMKLREMEEIDLVCGQSGALELAGRAEWGRPDFFFTVGEIDNKGDKQEDQKKSQIERLLIFFYHYTEIYEKSDRKVNL